MNGKSFDLSFSSLSLVNHNRPFTQQGLSGPTSLNSCFGPDRSIQDRTYYISQIRGKINEISIENYNLSCSLDCILKDNYNVSIYEQRAQNLSSEIDNFRNNIADYNLLRQTISTDFKLHDIYAEINDSSKDNIFQSNFLEQIFLNRQNLDDDIVIVKSKLSDLNNLIQSFTEYFDHFSLSAFHDLKMELNVTYDIILRNEEILRTLNFQNSQVNREIHSQRYISHVQLEIFMSKQHLINILNKIESNEEHDLYNREIFLEIVKKDNQQLIDLQNCINANKSNLVWLTEKRNSLLKYLEKTNGDKYQSLIVLKDREIEMYNSIEKHDDLSSEYSEKLLVFENQNYSLLFQSKKILFFILNLPLSFDYDKSGIDFKFKYFEKEKSFATSTSLATENANMTLDIKKLSLLQDKLHKDLKIYHKNISELTSNIVKVSDLNYLEISEIEKREIVLKLHALQCKKKEAYLLFIGEHNSNYELLNTVLFNNETLIQLNNLEQKLRHHKSSNYLIDQYLADKNIEIDYKHINSNVKLDLCKLNSILIKCLP